MIEENELMEVAREKKNDLSSERDCEWADCYNVSNEIYGELVSSYSVPEDYLSVEEFRDGDFRHYYLVIDARVLGEYHILDASFRQFASDTSVKFNLGSPSDIEEVVLVRKNRYIFETM